jgi:glycosyltransferase involved in cell wall biosynthesis
VPYRTIGHDVRSGIGLPLALLRYLAGGCRFLSVARRAGRRNVLFLYNEPSLESLLFVLWARLRGYTVVIDVVEDAYFIPGQAPLRSRLKALSARWTTAYMHWFADGIIVISTYLRDKLAAIVRDRVPLQLIPVSVDLERVPCASGGFHRPVRLLYAGNFGEKDDIECLLTAFEKVAATRPWIELLMTGKGVAARMAAVRRRIDASPLAGRIRYLGYLPDEEYFRTIGGTDIPCVIRAASVFAGRGFPFKLGEYLATGRPVIATRLGDISRYLDDRVSAMLVAPGSVEEIAAAIEYLLADEPRALEIGRAGRRVAEEHFSARRNGQRLLELIERTGPA